MAAAANGQQLYEQVGDPNIRPEDEPLIGNKDAEFKEFFRSLDEARTAQRAAAIKEGRLDDPTVAKRLEDAITIQGTCPDMCPRYERWRRQRDGSLTEFEVLPPPHQRQVDHRRAVKMYERGSGDKIIPSDIRPEPVLIKTLDYLFHELMPKEGFARVYAFLRDRTRSVRNDFAIQRLKTPGTMISHNRCARAHILSFQAVPEKEWPMEDQLLFNTLQSLKEMWIDSRAESPQDKNVIFEGELEMRLYHRLSHMRDQKERHDDVPEEIASFPAFKLVTEFRLHVQKESAPIKKNSALKVGEEGMMLFGQVVASLSENVNHPTPGMRTSRGTVFLIACILERLFGKGTVGDEQMTSLRAGATDPDLIDGTDFQAGQVVEPQIEEVTETGADSQFDDFISENGEDAQANDFATDTEELTEAPALGAFSGSAFAAPQPNGGSIFSSGSTSSIFGKSPFGGTGQSAFGAGGGSAGQNAFGSGTNAFSGGLKSAFGTSTAPTATIATESPFGLPSEKSAFGVISTTPASGGDGSSLFGKAPAASTFGTSAAIPSATAPAFPSTTENSTNPSSIFSAPSSNPSASTATPSLFGAEKPQTNGFGLSHSSKPAPTLNSLNPGAKEFVPSFGISASSAPAQSIPLPPATQPTPPTQPLDQPAKTPDRPWAFLAPPQSTSQGFTGSVKPQTTTPTSSLFPSTTTPQSTPPSAPFLPKLNTNLTKSISSSAAQPSPTLPNAPKQEPVSLPPSTPTSDFPSAPFSAGPSPHHSRTYVPSISSPLRNPMAGTSSSSASSTTLPGGKKEKPLLKGALLGKLDVKNLPTSNPSKVNGDGDAILSPLVIGSPSVSRQGSFENLNGSAGVGGLGLGLVNEVSGSPIVDKGKGREAPLPWSSPEKAVTHELSSEDENEKEERLNKMGDQILMKKVLGRWVKKVTDRAEYAEAVKRSVRYGSKVRTFGAGRTTRDSSLMRSGRSSPAWSESSKRRRLNEELDGGSESEFGGSVWSQGSHTKRRRRSAGHYEPPRSDEELERRLLEKQKETAIRWAPNSFLDHVKLRERSYLVGHQHGVPRQQSLPGNRARWMLWVSCNPENNGTAIWIEKKFGVGDVEKSGVKGGKWVAGSVYQVPVSEDSEGRNKDEFPGLVVFELTPLEGVDDPLERKYRILDDCSRLRDIVQALPTRRQYVPALLVLHWPTPGIASTATIGQDFVDLVSSYVHQGSLSSYAIFNCTTPAFELDPTFKNVVGSLTLDFDGKLARRLTTRAAFGLLEPFLKAFMDEWWNVCMKGLALNWKLYSQLLEEYITLLQRAGRTVAWFLQAEVGDLLPRGLDTGSFTDDTTAYAIVLKWLAGSLLGQAADLVSADIEGHRDLDQPFPGRAFLDHLKELLYSSAEQSLGTSAAPAGFLVLNQDIDSALRDFRQAVAEQQATLSKSYGLLVRRSPKRPVSSLQNSISSIDASSSKRLKLSNGIDRDGGGTLSTFLTPATSPPGSSPESDEGMHNDELESAPKKERVTVAMLRARTKEMRSRFASSNGS